MPKSGSSGDRCGHCYERLMSSPPGRYDAECCANPRFRFAVNGVHSTLGSTDVVPPQSERTPKSRGAGPCVRSPGRQSWVGRYSKFRVRQDGMNCYGIPHFRFGQQALLDRGPCCGSARSPNCRPTIRSETSQPPESACTATRPGRKWVASSNVFLSQLTRSWEA